MSISKIKPHNELKYSVEDLTVIRQYIEAIRNSSKPADIAGDLSYKNQGSLSTLLTDLGYPSILHPVILEINDLDTHTYEWNNRMLLPDRTLTTKILNTIGYK